jgi:putative Mg2+ transporter-C (MgtC) family protein
VDTWWQEIAASVAAEFSDVPTFAGVTRLVVRVVMAGVLSGMIGFERERKGKAAGLRTHMLVGLGSAIFVLVPQQAGVSDDAITRIIQGLVAGIGFLGAGAILKPDDEHIHGLTTAAGIWLTAAIGVAAGMGRETSAILSTGFALVILALLPSMERWARPNDGEQREHRNH